MKYPQQKQHGLVLGKTSIDVFFYDFLNSLNAIPFISHQVVFFSNDTL